MPICQLTRDRRLNERARHTLPIGCNAVFHSSVGACESGTSVPKAGAYEAAK